MLLAFTLSYVFLVFVYKQIRQWDSLMILSVGILPDLVTVTQ